MEMQDGRQPARDAGPEPTMPSNGRVRIDQTADRFPGRGPRVQEPRDLAVLPGPFDIVETTADGHRVIAPCGELDLSNAAQLEERLAGRFDTVLDLSELSFIDSTGIHVVISTARRAQLEAWEFTVRNPRPAVLRVIELVGLDRQLGLECQNGRAPHREDGKQPAQTLRSGSCERLSRRSSAARGRRD
jgi:anti-sigma B factor antagonist